MKGLTLVLCLLIQLHFSAGTFKLKLGELDYSVREDEGFAKVSISARGDLAEEITVEIVPLSFEEYRDSGYFSFNEVSMDVDHATPMLDYNATVLSTVIQPTSGVRESTFTFNVDIFDDRVSENSEVFFIHLRVVNGSERDDVEVSQNSSTSTVVIRIDPTDASSTIIGFNTDFLMIDEGVGIVDDLLFITIEGAAEPMLEVKLQMIAGPSSVASNDINFFSTKINFSSSDNRVPVPFSVVDDLIYEGLEDFQIQLVQPPSFANLYSIGSNYTLTMNIVDNDVAKIGFEVAEGTPLVIMEGQTREVCVNLFEPEELNAFIDLTIIETPQSVSGPSVSIIGETMFTLQNSTHRHCVQLVLTEDELVTATVGLVLSLELTFNDSSATIILEPAEISFTLLDNDGIPFVPRNVQSQLVNDGKDLLISWEFVSNDLQPIEQFAVEVRTRQPISRIAKRQSGSSVQTIKTGDNKIVLEDIDQDAEYFIQVCAENSLGRTCAKPIILKGNDLVVVIAKTDGVAPGLGNGVSPLPMFVYIIIAVALILVFLLLVLCFCACVCYRLRKQQHYYPAKEESKINKMEGAEGRYKARHSESTESVHWNCESESDCDPEDV